MDLSNNLLKIVYRPAGWPRKVVYIIFNIQLDIHLKYTNKHINLFQFFLNINKSFKNIRITYCWAGV